MTNKMSYREEVLCFMDSFKKYYLAILYILAVPVILILVPLLLIYTFIKRLFNKKDKELINEHK